MVFVDRTHTATASQVLLSSKTILLHLRLWDSTITVVSLAVVGVSFTVSVVDIP